MQLMWNPGDPYPASMIDDEALLNGGGHSGILSTFSMSWPPALDGGNEASFPSKVLFSGVDAYAPGGRTTEHTHADREKLFVVLDGSVRMTVGEDTRVLTPGAFAFVPVGAVHGFENAGSGVLWIAQIIAYLGDGAQVR